MKNTRPTRALIDQTALRHNLQCVRAFTTNASLNAKVMAVVKADGYGHGMEVVAEALSAADEFAVNGFDDAIRLRAAGITQPITLFCDCLSTEHLNQLSGQQLRPTLFNLSQLDAFEGIAPSASLSVWLKVDTGMGRLGVLPDEFAGVLERLQKIPGVADISLMTHLANADDIEHPLNKQQLDLFAELSQQHSFKQLSILNSAGVIAYPQTQQNQTIEHIVRPGVMLYGISPMLGKTAADHDLDAVMTLQSELISVKTLKAGSSIGYGSTVTLEKDTRIGVVACGYGDGYPRHAPSGTPVLLNGQTVKLLGRVSMDMICVDLDDVPAKAGDEVVLWGKGNPVELVAQAAGTIAYELICAVLPRVERINVK